MMEFFFCVNGKESFYFHFSSKEKFMESIVQKNFAKRNREKIFWSRKIQKNIGILSKKFSFFSKIVQSSRKSRNYL